MHVRRKPQFMHAAKHTGRDDWVGCLLEDVAPPGGTQRDVPGYGQASVPTSFPDTAVLRWSQ